MMSCSANWLWLNWCFHLSRFIWNIFNPLQFWTIPGWISCFLRWRTFSTTFRCSFAHDGGSTCCFFDSPLMELWWLDCFDILSLWLSYYSGQFHLHKDLLSLLASDFYSDEWCAILSSLLMTLGLSRSFYDPDNVLVLNFRFLCWYASSRYFIAVLSLTCYCSSCCQFLDWPLMKVWRRLDCFNLSACVYGFAIDCFY